MNRLDDWIYVGLERGIGPMPPQYVIFEKDTSLPTESDFYNLSYLPKDGSGFPLAVLYQGSPTTAATNPRLTGFVLPDKSNKQCLRIGISSSGELSAWLGNTPLQRLNRSGDSRVRIKTTQTTPQASRHAVEGRIFVSHAASDASHALKLVEAIERTGKRCWIAPRDVRAGRDFREEIVAAIQQCESMVVLISQNANDKPQHILRELSLAEKSGKTVKPVRLDDCKVTSALEYQLEGLHWVRFEPSFTFVNSLMVE
jgi:hypothetical protein